MAARVTQEEVEAIIDVDTNITSDLTPFIAAATSVVDNNLVDKGLDDPTLKEIERWLSAHFTAVQDKRFIEEEAGGTKSKYEGKTAFYFEFTGYGQVAITLDPTGTLASLQKGKRPIATMKAFTRVS